MMKKKKMMSPTFLRWGQLKNKKGEERREMGGCFGGSMGHAIDIWGMEWALCGAHYLNNLNADWCFQLCTIHSCLFPSMVNSINSLNILKMLFWPKNKKQRRLLLSFWDWTKRVWSFSFIFNERENLTTFEFLTCTFKFC